MVEAVEAAEGEDRLGRRRRSGGRAERPPTEQGRVACRLRRVVVVVSAAIRLANNSDGTDKKRSILGWSDIRIDSQLYDGGLYNICGALVLNTI